MQISQRSPGHFELKTRDTLLTLNQEVTIGDYQIPGPGEYEVAGVMAEVTVHATRILADDLRIGFLTSGLKKLSDLELEQLGSFDLLFASVNPGGSEPLPAKDFLGLVSQFEVPLVIPILSEAETRQAYQELPQVRRQTGPLKLTSNQLPEEGTEIVIFD